MHRLHTRFQRGETSMAKTENEQGKIPWSALFRTYTFVDDRVENSLSEGTNKARGK